MRLKRAQNDGTHLEKNNRKASRSFSGIFRLLIEDFYFIEKQNEENTCGDRFYACLAMNADAKIRKTCEGDFFSTLNFAVKNLTMIYYDKIGV